MIQIDAGIIAIFVSVLAALLGMAVGWGTLHEKVKNNRKDIDCNQKQNREDHLLMFSKLDEIRRGIKNGYGNHRK